MKMIDIPEDTLRELYLKQDLSIAQISKILKVSVTPVYESLVRHDIPRKSKGKKRFNHITGEMLQTWYWTEKKTVQAISKIIPCSRHTVKLLMDDRGVKMRSGLEACKLRIKDNFDENGHGFNWRGGLVKSHGKDGYLLEWCPNHPRANNGYVYQHILVWERTHNRPLPKGWIVHHVNGMRNDNRPENLIGMKKQRHDNIIKVYRDKIYKLEQKVKELELALANNQLTFSSAD